MKNLICYIFYGLLTIIAILCAVLAHNNLEKLNIEYDLILESNLWGYEYISTGHKFFEVSGDSIQVSYRNKSDSFDSYEIKNTDKIVEFVINEDTETSMEMYDIIVENNIIPYIEKDDNTTIIGDLFIKKGKTIYHAKLEF